MENYEDNPEDGTDTVQYKRDENNLEYGNYGNEDHIQTPNEDGAVDVDMSKVDNSKEEEQPLVRKRTHKKKTYVINNIIGEHEHPSGKIEIQRNKDNIFVKNEINQKKTHAPGESIEDSILDDVTRLFYTVFNKSNIILVIWFLAIYFICYLLIGIIFKKNVDNYNHQIRLSKMLDIVLLCFFLLFLIASYYSIPNIKKQDILENTATKTVNFIENPNSLAIMLFVMVLFYIIIYLFRIPMTYETKPFFISLVENGAWILLLVIVFVQFFKIVFDLDMLGAIGSFLNWKSLPFHSDGTGASDGSHKTTSSSINSGRTTTSGSMNTTFSSNEGGSYQTTASNGMGSSTMTTLFNTVSSYFTTEAPNMINVSLSDDTSYVITSSPDATVSSLQTTSSPATTASSNAFTTTKASTVTTSSPATTSSTVTTSSPATTSSSVTTTSKASTTTTKQGFVGSMKSHSRLTYDTMEEVDTNHWTNLYAYDNYSDNKQVKHNPYINFGKSAKINSETGFASAGLMPPLAKSENDVILENKIRKWNGNLADRNVIVNVYDNGQWK